MIGWLQQWRLTIQIPSGFGVL